MENPWTWNVEAGDRTQQITISDSGSGKFAVRVNGKAATKPFAEGDTERTFMIEGFECRITRSADGSFDLEMTPIFRATSAIGNSDLRESVFNARAMAWGLIALLVVSPFIWYVWNNTYARQAQRRVKAVLEGMTTTPDAATVGLWARDTRHLGDARELSWASDHFDDWLREKDFYGKPVSQFHVISAHEVKGAEVPTVTVHVVIDTRDLSMVVPERRPISWANEGQ